MTLTKKLAVLGILGLTTGLVSYVGAVPRAAPKRRRSVKITASKFHFTPDASCWQGQPVTLQLTSADRTHGFMVRAFGIDTDIKPGKTTAITIRPEKVGTLPTICDHYCGLGHSGMKMTVVVQEASAKSSAAPVVSASNTVSK